MSSGGKPPAPRPPVPQASVRRLPIPDTTDGGSENAKMKSLFKSKPRTPVDLVRQTRDLLIFADLGAPDTKESKRDEKVVLFNFLAFSFG